MSDMEIYLQLRIGPLVSELPTNRQESAFPRQRAPQEYNDAYGWPSPLVPDSDRTKFNHRSELGAWARFIGRWIHGSNASSPSRFFPLIVRKALRPRSDSTAKH